MIDDGADDVSDATLSDCCERAVAVERDADVVGAGAAVATSLDLATGGGASVRCSAAM
jgi:hypothetical protein